QFQTAVFKIVIEFCDSGGIRQFSGAAVKGGDQPRGNQRAVLDFIGQVIFLEVLGASFDFVMEFAQQFLFLAPAQIGFVAALRQKIRRPARDQKIAFGELQSKIDFFVGTHNMISPLKNDWTKSYNIMRLGGQGEKHSSVRGERL